MSIAFFDLDKTLLSENSAKLWLSIQWHTRQINLPQMIRASYWLAKYHLGFSKMDKVIEKLLLLLNGESERELLKLTKKFYRSSIKHLYRPGALRTLKQHKKLGHKVSLLTSSFDGLALLVKNDLDLDYCLCTRLEVDQEGQYTGKTIGPPCFGRHKVSFAEELCDSLDIPLHDCTFYTDSASDIPLLNLVGRAVAVNPDPHLRARAQIKKWEIVDWGRPGWAQNLKR
ncbi:MAG TPA: HAD-IB family hydrolase [Myxococcota bacterium]|nr:HAD-IB family hydrolase [Myxococcota bacterium]